MKRINSALFLATVASMALASGASAQTAPGPNDGDSRLHGAGATAVQEVVWQEQDCLGDSIQARPCPVPGEPLVPGFASTYQATGSGLGRQAWRNVTPQIPAQPTWDVVQFAFSETGTSSTELAQYNANVAPYSRAGIIVPKFVLPVAIAYNPVYATEGGNQYRFRVNPSFAASTTQINGVGVGGMRMPRAVYCGIFNGTIVNWNDAALRTANGNQSLGDSLDASWTTLGAPIRLVGRMDRSGTTDIFTRALAAQCSGSNYTTNAEALPYGRVPGAADFSSVRADTPYSLTSTAGLAGTTNMVGNQYYSGAPTNPSVPGGSASDPAPGSHNGSGLFLMADGSGNVAAAIAAAPDVTRGSRVYNGKVGYIGADFIVNASSGNPNLHAAALSRPSAPNAWHLPSSAAASTALGTVTPPESNSSGTFANFGTDVRTNPLGGTFTVARADPLSWYRVLYPSPLTGLAAPSAGYPLTGTTQVQLHTCYKPTNAPHIKAWLGYNVATPTDVFTNPTTGLLAKSNIGALPSDWRAAINQTFLTNSNQTSNGQRLGNLDLWIEAAGPTSDHCNVATLAGETQPGM